MVKLPHLGRANCTSATLPKILDHARDSVHHHRHPLVVEFVRCIAHSASSSRRNSFANAGLRAVMRGLKPAARGSNNRATPISNRSATTAAIATVTLGLMRTIVAVLTLVAATAADACTTFCGSGLFGRSYDFEIGYGLVIANKRGVHKTAQTAKPASWKSRFGNITFNQYGRDSATGGMNEQGLVVELMWLDGTRYPAADARGEVGTLEWIQYQLDTASSVAEVIASDTKVRIAASSAPLHYLIADASGDTAAIEFLDGKMVVHRGAIVLANDPYRDSVAAMKGGARDRFARATRGLPMAMTVRGAFALLDDVKQPHTRWQIVYDIRNRAIHWRTAVNRKPRSVRLRAFDFSCATPVQIADIDYDRFRDYTREQNAALVRRSMRGTSFLRNTSDAEIEEAAQWPERSTCAH